MDLLNQEEIINSNSELNLNLNPNPDIENQFGFYAIDIFNYDSPKKQLDHQIKMYISDDFDSFDNSDTNVDKNNLTSLTDLSKSLTDLSDSNSYKVKKSKSYPNDYTGENTFDTSKSIVFFELEKDNIGEKTQEQIQEQIQEKIQEHDYLIDIGKTYSDINSSPKKKLLENETTCEYIKGLFIKIYNYFGLDKVNWMKIINTMISVCLHVFIMVIFEIYFYFNYVVWIEKESFLNEIDRYLGELDTIPLTLVQKDLIKMIINLYPNNSVLLDYLYNEYIKSLSEQKKLLGELLVKACMMGGIVGLFLLVFVLAGLIDRKKIEWKWILIENIFMFMFLGVFEYFFFMKIIMNYSPITDAEIKYYVAKEIFNYFNTTSTGLI